MKQSGGRTGEQVYALSNVNGVWLREDACDCGGKGGDETP